MLEEIEADRGDEVGSGGGTLVAQGDPRGSLAAEATIEGAGVGAVVASSMAMSFQQAARRRYGLPEEDVEAAVLAASEVHGAVAKAGPLPPEFWSAERRPWREAVFNAMVARDMAQPRSGEYWEADAAGELALRPLALPFPLCHTYVNHRYKIIFIIHPKSASTATKRYLTLCRLQRTESCLSPLEDPAELAPLEEKWRDYFVFTFVRNPWARAYSSWKFLRESFMLRPGSAGRKGGAVGPPCVRAAWPDFCGDPLLLGRVCLAQPHCCPGKEKDHFMFYHITDQATCLASPGGGLAVDFVGRVERVDEDMAAAVQLINGRLPPGVPPLQLPAGVAPINVGPQDGAARSRQVPDNSRYLPAYQGANATCFARLARFYEKDVRLMYPSLYEAERAAEAREAALAGGGAALVSSGAAASVATSSVAAAAVQTVDGRLPGDVAAIVATAESQAAGGGGAAVAHAAAGQLPGGDAAAAAGDRQLLPSDVAALQGSGQQPGDDPALEGAGQLPGGDAVAAAAA